MTKWNLIGWGLVLSVFGWTGSALAETKQYKVEAISLTVEQLVTPGIAYHTPEELGGILKERVTALLGEKHLLTDKDDVSKLVISAHYQRRFVGDQTPVPSDALAYPQFRYKVDVQDNAQTVATVEKSDMTYSGGFAMNMKVMAGALRDKKYELEFVDALANSIVEEVEGL